MYENFSLEEELQEFRAGKGTTVATVFEREEEGPRCGRDKDGRLLWVALPGAIQPAALVSEAEYPADLLNHRC